MDAGPGPVRWVAASLQFAAHALFAPGEPLLLTGSRPGDVGSASEPLAGLE